MRPIDTERIEAEIEGRKRKRDDIEARIEEVEATLEKMKTVSENSDTLAGRIQELRERKRSLDETVNQLGSVIKFNRGPKIVLFHDAGNSPALFEAFVRWLCDHDGELGAPLVASRTRWAQ